ncbi:MAG: YeeE/YedE family protein [Deltaproteobacteria bacterium]|nr:YeeE/YedE family protein [Deltaproteobacteria bacterium]
MNLDWNQFTPLQSLLGGALIGLAAALKILFNGRVAGISGIVSGLLKPTPAEWKWRLAFVFGLIAAPWAYQRVAVLPASNVEADWPMLIVAGLLVGIGTRYGSGCTSGHGVCGLARLSPRSLMATLTFMLAGIVTVYLIRHLLGA